MNQNHSKISKGISTPIGILVIVVLDILVGGVLLWQSQKIPSKEKLPAIETPEKPVSEVEDETADWKIYRNEEYGFEIKYPLEWKVLEERFNDGLWEKQISFISNLGKVQSEAGVIEIENGKVCYEHFLGGPERHCFDYIIPYKVNIFIYPKLKWEDPCIPIGAYCEEVILSDKIRGISWGGGTDIGGCAMIDIPTNQFVIRVQSCIFDVYRDYEECRKFFDKMLSTFRFIE